MPPSKNKAAGASRTTKQAVVQALSEVFDPELGVDIHTLGFIRRIDLSGQKNEIRLEMTLTSPLCPHGPQMVKEVKDRLKALGLTKVAVELVFDPPWEPTPEVRRILGF